LLPADAAMKNSWAVSLFTLLLNYTQVPVAEMTRYSVDGQFRIRQISISGDTVRFSYYNGEPNPHWKEVPLYIKGGGEFSHVDGNNEPVYVFRHLKTEDFTYEPL
jgi:hypothetical protein